MWDKYRIKVSLKASRAKVLARRCDVFHGADNIGVLAAMDPGDKIKVTLRCTPDSWVGSMKLLWQGIKLVERRCIECTADGVTISAPERSAFMTKLGEDCDEFLESQLQKLIAAH